MREWLSLEWNGAAGQPAGIGRDHGYRTLRRFSRHYVLPRGDLLLYPLDQLHQLLRFMVSLCLFAHLLEILRRVAHTIRHEGYSLLKVILKDDLRRRGSLLNQVPSA